jgi:uncharacterized protein YukE
MGYPHGFEIHPSQLRGISAKVADAATLTGQAYTSHQVGLAPAGGRAAGWSTTAAAASASSVWGTFVNQLARSAESLASELKTAAETYERADADAAGRHRGARMAF